MKILQFLKESLSLLFGKSEPPPSAQPRRFVFLIRAKDSTQLGIYQENLRSHTIDFEVRSGHEIFVLASELEIARSVIQEGQWDY